MFLIDRYNLLTLQKLLGGHQELSETIIRYKNHLELEDHKQETIDRHFYYWLTYDLPLRSWLGEIVIEYQTLEEETKEQYIREMIEQGNHKSFPLIDYFQYYDTQTDRLGLESKYERKTPLHTCFQTQWWKTTEKHSLPWKRIHSIIGCQNEVKIYKQSFRYFVRHTELLNEMKDYPENFREPTLKERYKIYCSIPWMDLLSRPDSKTLIFTDQELTLI